MPNILNRIREFFAPQAATLSVTKPDGWGAVFEGGRLRDYGASVSQDTAMSCAVANRCVLLISGILASLDLCVYRDDPLLGRVKVIDHPFHSMLTVRPWGERSMTAYQWREQIEMNVLLGGNSFSIIRMTRGGKIVGFEHAPWSKVITRIDTVTQRLSYEIHWGDGRADEIVPASQMLHIPGPGFCGRVGLSRVSYFAQNSIALHRTLQQTLGAAHDNAMQPRIVISVGEQLSPKGLAELKENVRKKSGTANAGETIIVEGGSKVEQLGINLVDLNLIEAMQATSLDIANIFGVPSVLLNIPSGATEWGSGIDSLWRAFYATTLGAELRRIESEFTAKLFPRGDFYVAFDRSQLLQNDPKQQAEINSIEIQSAQKTPNEIRREMHLPLIENGDEPLVNAAVVPLKNLVNQPVSQPAPPAAPEDIADAQ